MLLSQTAQYALRAVARLSALPAGAAARSRDLSDETGVPGHYLAKILRMLVQAGLLVSEKGHHGGFRLKHPASAIKVADVLFAVDEGLELKDCAFGYSRCDPKSPCPLHPIVSQLNDSVREWADRTTLAAAGRELKSRSSSSAS
jgi:Rrf2 family protein